MPKKLRIYLDTSVPNAYFDDRNLPRQELTRRFWERLGDYDVFVSDVVVTEIEDIRDTTRKKGLLRLIEGFRTLSSRDEEIKALAEEYVMRGVVPLKHIEDATHIAVASFHNLDVLISWNYEHIVKLKTKREVNVINVLLGYHPLEIIEPSML
jgi:predicted nucleic acid-binding protein